MANGTPRFWKVHTTDGVGSYSRACLTILDLAREVLSAFDGRTYSLRVTELECDEARTYGKKIVQDIRVKARCTGRSL